MLIVASCLNFFIVVFIVWKFSRKPFSEMIVHRSEVIEISMHEAKENFEKASSFFHEWEVKWSNVEKVVMDEMESVKKMVSNLEFTRMSNAQKIADRLKEEAKLIRKRELEKAENSLRREMVEKSIEESKKFLRASLVDEDQKKMVRDYVEVRVAAS